MKRIYFALIAAIFVLASCEEWDQVFTTDYGKADVYEPVTMTPTRPSPSSRLCTSPVR